MYNLLMEVAGACATAARRLAAPDPSSPLLALRAGLAESPAWFLVQAAELAPEPLSVERLRIRDVYASERIVRALLDIMAGEQWLTRSATDDYHLTPLGATYLDSIRARRNGLGRLQGFSSVDPGHVASILGRLIDASSASTEPPGTWCLAHSRNRAPANDAPALTRIAAYLDDFNAFRDDAHMAAWQPYGIDGYVWEAFSLVCDGTATRASEVYEQLVYRGYIQHEYAGALGRLMDRGWLASDDALLYQVTPQGREGRASVEHETDRFFYEPWAILTDAEIYKLEAQLRSLRDVLLAGSSIT
jgi:hypothetical protein